MRILHKDEKDVLVSLLALAHCDIVNGIGSILVEDMEDGGMGSIRFLSDSVRERVLGDIIAEAEYVDEDGVLVSIVLNADKVGSLYELDFWKVDFSPLCRYPRPEQLRVKL